MTTTEPLVAGRYRIVRPLGAGGMGRVWLARDEVLRRDVAIKEIVLPLGLPDAQREELRLRTLREARAAARLSHPNVVRIYDVQSGDEQPWIVMEHVQSRSLLQVIEENGPLPVEQVAGIGSRSSPRWTRPTGPECSTGTSSPATCSSPTTGGSYSPTSAPP